MAANGTILIVEDEPAIRRLHGRCLTDAGYTCVEAETIRAGAVDYLVKPVTPADLLKAVAGAKQLPKPVPAAPKPRVAMPTQTAHVPATLTSLEDVWIGVKEPIIDDLFRAMFAMGA